MTAKLTERMQAWVETGCHLNVASADGKPHVAIARSATVVDDGEVAFPLSTGEFGVLRPALTENPWVSFGVSGKMRAPYQFKGIGRVAREGPAFEAVAEEDTHAVLYVDVEEIYCTKPGAEAGKRLDVMPFDELVEWEAERWTDMPGDEATDDGPGDGATSDGPSDD